MKLGNSRTGSRTGSSSRFGGTTTKCAALPMSIPAALRGDRQYHSGLTRLEAEASIALSHGVLHHSLGVLPSRLTYH